MTCEGLGLNRVDVMPERLQRVRKVRRYGSRRASASTRDRNFGDGQIFLSGRGSERDRCSHVFFRERGDVLEDLGDGGALGQAGQDGVEGYPRSLQNSLPADDSRVPDDQFVVVHRPASILAD